MNCFVQTLPRESLRPFMELILFVPWIRNCNCSCQAQAAPHPPPACRVPAESIFAARVLFLTESSIPTSGAGVGWEGRLGTGPSDWRPCLGGSAFLLPGPPPARRIHPRGPVRCWAIPLGEPGPIVFRLPPVPHLSAPPRPAFAWTEPSLHHNPKGRGVA